MEKGRKKKEKRKKEQEEKKKKLEEKRRAKEEAKGAKSPKKRNVVKKNKGKQWRQTLNIETLENNENICQVCFVEYTDGDEVNFPWVKCDSCLSWMHVQCVPIDIDTSPIDDGKEFFCHNCD